MRKIKKNMRSHLSVRSVLCVLFFFDRKRTVQYTY